MDKTQTNSCETPKCSENVERMKKPPGLVGGAHASFANWIAGPTPQSRDSNVICCSLCGRAEEIEKGSNRDIGEGLMGILCDQIEDAVRNMRTEAAENMTNFNMFLENH